MMVLQECDCFAWRVGKRFPLLVHVDIGQQLTAGCWIVVFFRNDCPKCQEMMPHYQQQARGSVKRSGEPRFAFIEVPSHSEAFPLIDPSPEYVIGRLSSEREWFIQLPNKLEIDLSIVTTNTKGEDI